MRKIQLTKDKILLEDAIEEVYEDTVKPIGNGAMIMSAKRFIGKKVYVLVKK
jgi:putative transposon-encoded protein